MTVFHGERNSVAHGSGLTGVYQHQQHQSSNLSSSQQLDPRSNPGSSATSVDSGYFGSYSGINSQQQLTPPYDSPSEMMCIDGTRGNIEGIAWMEIWDYQGGSSFRAFMAEDFVRDEKSLFTFFDAGIVGRDLKKALVALIELADAPLGCSQLVICIDRAIQADDLQTLTKGLQWAGFELATLDHWAGSLDVTSKQWIFMGMEV